EPSFHLFIDYIDYIIYIIFTFVLNSEGFSQLIYEATRITANSQSCIDHIFTNISTSCSSSSLAVEIADHLLVFTISYDPKFSPFPDYFELRVNIHAPLKKAKIKHKAYKPWITSGLKKSMKVRDKLYKNGLLLKIILYRNKIAVINKIYRDCIYNGILIKSDNMKKMWDNINLWISSQVLTQKNYKWIINKQKQFCFTRVSEIEVFLLLERKLYPTLTVVNVHLEKSFCVKYLDMTILTTYVAIVKLQNKAVRVINLPLQVIENMQFEC
ncbi:hypothetical protein pdam_00024460, partial [Pocillopora damicornis]